MSCSVCRGYQPCECPCCGQGMPSMKECPDCHGTGKTPYLAFNIREKEIEEVTELAWLIMPEDEEEVEEKMKQGKRWDYFRWEKGGYECLCCGGRGEVPETWY